MYVKRNESSNICVTYVHVPPQSVLFHANNTRGQLRNQALEQSTVGATGGAIRAIHQVFRSRRSLQSSSAELFEGDFAIQRCVVQAGEQTERVATDYCFLILWEAHVAEGELASVGGHYRRYKKYPNTISTFVRGFFPAVRTTSIHTSIVCALNLGLMTRIEGGLDWAPQELLYELNCQDDFVLRNIMRLLIKEAEDGEPSGKLYGESLAMALATRLLYLGKSATQPESEKILGLPLRTLRKVLDRMQSGIHADPDLKTLASEAGYSQSRFLRMFRDATDTTPHQYLLDVKLEKVKELLATRKIPLIDIAAACGFSSHSHLSTAFRKRFGATPSRYARELNRK
jgi:AraC family transcriptional regulator